MEPKVTGVEIIDQILQTSGGTPDIVTHEGKEIEMTDKDCGEPDSADAGNSAPEHGVSQSDHQKRGVEVDRAILLQRVCVSDVGFNLEPAARFIESHCERATGDRHFCQVPLSSVLLGGSERHAVLFAKAGIALQASKDQSLMQAAYIAMGTSEHDQLHIHFQFYAAGEGGDSLIGSPEEDAIIAWLEEELHWPQPPAEGPCVWTHRVADEIPATRLCPALPWCDSLPRKDAEEKWSRIMAMLPEWQNYPVFEAFGFITNDNNFDDEIKGFVLREETMTEFELPPRCGCRNS